MLWYVLAFPLASNTKWNSDRKRNKEGVIIAVLGNLNVCGK
jgi:hypothetical protein